MSQIVSTTASHAMAPATQGLRQALDRVQFATYGSAELDALLIGEFDAARHRPGGSNLPAHGATWTTNAAQAHALLPAEHNFSVGQRDGVCWAWTQPDDGWEPSEHEARHDHPDGSGLVVASTVALALTCAALVFYIKRIEAAA